MNRTCSAPGCPILGQWSVAGGDGAISTSDTLRYEANGVMVGIVEYQEVWKAETCGEQVALISTPFQGGHTSVHFFRCGNKDTLA